MSDFVIINGIAYEANTWQQMHEIEAELLNAAGLTRTEILTGDPKGIPEKTGEYIYALTILTGADH